MSENNLDCLKCPFFKVEISFSCYECPTYVKALEKQEQFNRECMEKLTDLDRLVIKSKFKI